MYSASVDCSKTKHTKHNQINYITKYSVLFYIELPNCGFYTMFCFSQCILTVFNHPLFSYYDFLNFISDWILVNFVLSRLCVCDITSKMEEDKSLVENGSNSTNEEDKILKQLEEVDDSHLPPCLQRRNRCLSSSSEDEDEKKPTNRCSDSDSDTDSSIKNGSEKSKKGVIFISNFFV